MKPRPNGSAGLESGSAGVQVNQEGGVASGDLHTNVDGRITFQVRGCGEAGAGNRGSRGRHSIARDRLYLLRLEVDGEIWRRIGRRIESRRIKRSQHWRGALKFREERKGQTGVFAP